MQDRYFDAAALREHLPICSKPNVKQPAFVAAGCQLLSFILENKAAHEFPTQVPCVFLMRCTHAVNTTSPCCAGLPQGSNS